MAATITALILDEKPSVTVGGLTLTERAVRVVRRIGFDPIEIIETGSELFDRPPNDQPLAIIGPNVLFEPAALTELVGYGSGGERTAVAACEAGRPLLVYLSGSQRAEVRSCRSLEALAATLAARGALRELAIGNLFCRRVPEGPLGPSMERAYIRHLNGPNESFFTKQIRRFSVPLTMRLVRLGARPTDVTLGGLALALAAAGCLALGSYGAGILGAILYYASMVADCSDGEVARLTVRDSAFGAWLETLVDYVTYFLVLGALTAASQRHPDADALRSAAAVALVGSLFVAVVAGYLRRRVAAADPGQFDEASARVMAEASWFHRGASWSRQWIKRSTIAHLVLALAILDQLHVLLYLWALGATIAAIVILAVEPLVVRRVSVATATVRRVGYSSTKGV